MLEPEVVQTLQESHVDISQLLSYPYFWKPTKITTFLKASWNIIKDGDYPNFVQNLSDNSNQVFTSCTDSWVEILGQEHWDILKCDGRGKVRQKPSTAESKCVVELIRLIRNKYEHCQEYEDVQKNVLNWFNFKGELVDEKFITYWTNKFPLLLTFLWMNFHKFKNHSTLKDYYWSSYTSTNCWKPDKTLSFLHQSWKILKSTRHHEFNTNINNNSYRAFSFNEPVWVRVIGKKHWNILKCDSNGILKHKPDGAQSKSVIELLKLVWDQYEHSHEYKPEDKTSLGWFNKQGELDEAKFITYWIDKFPLMLPYLWSSFYEFKSYSSLKEFYFGWEDEPDIRLILSVDDYSKQLNKSLDAHFEQGELLKRFTCQLYGQLSKIVEFRAINGLEKILDGNSAVSILLSPGKGCLSATFYSKTTGLEYSLDYNGLSLEPLHLIFVDDLLEAPFWNFCKNASSRILVYGDEQRMSYETILEATCKLKKVSGFHEITESPASWKDLSKLRRKRLFKHGRVIIQGKVEKVKTLFHGYKTHDILAGISGEFLNRLLKYEKVLLFGEYHRPELDQLYIERVLYIDGCVTTCVLSERYRKNTLVDYQFNDRRPRDIIIVTNITRKKLSELTGKENIVEVETIQELELNSRCNIYLVRQEFDNSLEMQYYFNLEYHERLFYARFVNMTDLFLWIYRDGQLIVATDIWPDIFVLWREQDFVEKVIRERKDAIFFTGEPGWGKSQLLISLGRRLRKGVAINVTMVTFVQKISAEILDEDCTAIAIKNVIQQFLRCQNDSERHIISNLLVQHQHGLGFKRVELMLDSLDEVPTQNRGLAMKALQLVQSELPGVRLWITSRESFPNDPFCSNFTYVLCKISPFNIYDQKTFFRTFWCKKNIFNIAQKDIGNLAYEFVDSLCEGVREKLKTCITMSPLHCRLLAELYEDKLNEMLLFIKKGEIFAKLAISPTLVYEALIEKKILVYIREKEKIVEVTNSLVIREAREQFLKKHILLALKLLVPGELYANKDDEIHDLQEFGLEKLGIITSKNGEEPLFVHRTYAEYLVARFIFKVLKSGKVYVCDSIEAYHDIIVHVMSIIHGDYDSFRFPVICMFLNEILDMNDDEYEEIILQWLNRYGKHKPKLHNILKYLEILFQFEYFNISKLILDIWIHDENDSFYSNILKIAIRNNVNINSFMRLCNIFGYEQKGMDIGNCDHFEVFQTALRLGNYDISKYLIEEWFPPKAWQLISKLRNGGGGIMHIILECNSQIFNDLDRESEKDKIKLMKLIHEMDASVIEIKDMKGRTPLRTICLVDYSGYCYWLRDFMIKELGAYDSGERDETPNMLDTNMRRNIIRTLLRLFVYFNTRIKTMWRNLLR